MEINREGNKEENRQELQNPTNVGKEMDQGHSKDDDISTLNELLGNPEILTSVLATPTMKFFVSGLQKEAVLIKTLSNVGKEMDEGPSTRDESQKTSQQQAIVQKEIDQGPSEDDGDDIDELLGSPDILRSVVATPTMQRFLLAASSSEESSPTGGSPFGFALDSTPTRLFSLIEHAVKASRSVPSKPKIVRDLIHKLASRSGPSTPKYSTRDEAIYPSTTATPKSRLDYSTPEYSTPEHPIYPSTTATPTSRQSISTATTLSVPSTPIEYPIIASTTATPMSRLRFSTSNDCGEDECKQMEEQIGKEVKFEYLLDLLKQIPEVTFQKKENVEVRLQKKGAMQMLQRVKRELARVWNELRILKQVDKRWCILEEVANLFDVSLKLSYPQFYPQFKDGKSTFFSCIEKFGDYQCEDVLRIWHKLREEHGGPRRVGWKIKRTLEVMRPKMIEREPWVLDIGFVSIKLSGKWMAEGIHKMLRDGIDTWAPKLLVKSVLVNFPSCNPAYLTQMDLLRRELIKTTLMCMLQYCKIPVEFSMPCEMALPQEELKIEKGDEGDVLIHSARGEREPLIHVKRHEWSGDPEKDIADLWYGLKKKNARWIVYVTPVQQQEYIKMCIKAAQHAMWLPLHWYDSPRASYTGYQTFNGKVKLEDLVSLLNDAKNSCKAAAKELGYTGEQVSNCALKYAILKNDRLGDYTFNYEDLVNAKENTFAYLLNTRFLIHSFTEESGKDIHNLKEASKLQLEKGEIWKEGVERELALHLLKFTEVITESCLPVLPHILCEYLYDLSKNFNSVCEVGFVLETTKSLLCEATRVVMEKCFELLGITPVLSSQEFFGVDWPQAFQVESLRLVKDLPRTTNARFELLSVYPHITRDPNFTKGNMFGQITICDTYNVLSDGWGPTSVPDHGFVSLFDHDWYNSVDITNHWPVYLGDPSSRRLVPFSSFMEIRVELYASTEDGDAFFELYNKFFETDLEEFWEDEADTRCDVFIRHGKDGYIGLYYLLLKDAIDCAIKVRYVPKKDDDGEDGDGEDGDGEIFAEIFAYPSSDFFDKQDPLAKNFYAQRLFRSTFDPCISEIPLERSMLAIPANGSVVIKACLWDVESGVEILDGSWTFNTGFGGERKLDAPCGSSLHVSMNWYRD